MKKPRYLGAKSDHFNGLNFFNPWGFHHKTLWDVLKWQILTKKVSWPKWVENKGKPNLPETLAQSEVAITFINHATLLIQFSDLNILTDPVYSERVSPVQWIGPRRVRNPGLAFEMLPRIDVVLISHNHYDHMDKSTLLKLQARFAPKFYIGLGDGEILNSFGLTNWTEMDWWQREDFQKMKISYTPAKHFSGRAHNDHFLSLWGGFFFEHNQHKIYFAGDTGYSPHFKDIAARLGSPTVSLLPIGAYEPRYFMKDAHVNPEESVQAHLDLGSKKSIGMHYGTFRLTDEGLDAPVKDLQLALEKFRLDPEHFLTLQEGETRIFSL